MVILTAQKKAHHILEMPELGELLTIVHIVKQ